MEKNLSNLEKVLNNCFQKISRFRWLIKNYFEDLENVIPMLCKPFRNMKFEVDQKFVCPFTVNAHFKN